MTADEIRSKAGLSFPHDAERTDAVLRQAIVEAADEIEALCATIDLLQNELRKVGIETGL